ncbi:MAG: hypothetical protein R2794_04570, partial [Chitinophagales bacterium]
MGFRKNNKRYFFIACVCLLCPLFLHAQTIQVVQEGVHSSLRGLSVWDDQNLWVSGSNGYIARSSDGGASFMPSVIPG